MIIGHSYQSTFPFAVYKDSSFGGCLDARIQDATSFLVVDTFCVDSRFPGKLYNGYQVLGPGFIGWILMHKEQDRKLDKLGNVRMPVLSGKNHLMKDLCAGTGNYYEQVEIRTA